MSWLRTVEFSEAGEVDLAREVAVSGVLRITCTPPDTATVVRTLSALGTPLEYYGDDAGTHPDHPAIWRVRYEHDASLRGETHALAGPLPVHSSQSLLDDRPPYFVMLMVNAGWRDNEPGFNGESLLAPWAEAIELLAGTVDSWANVRATLTSPVLYPDGQSRLLAYDLVDPASEFDLGVRFKSGMVEHIKKVLGETSSMAEAVVALDAAAQQVARRVPLDAGDLIVVDNNRWAHGRLSVVGSRDAGKVVNPRELWSLTLA
jgi:hypothetical protein